MTKIFKGIDLSRHNIVTNWEKVKDQVDFCILRAGGNFGGYYKDSKFEQYYAACKKLGIPVGAYYDAGKELWCADGKEYAQHFMKLIQGKTFEYPVYIDIEVTPKRYRKANTGAAIAFCEEMEAHKYFTGIYGSDINTFKEMLDYVNGHANRMSLESFSLSYDTATGLLSGSSAINMYCVTGTDKAYVEQNLSGVKLGTDNIFGTIRTGE